MVSKSENKFLEEVFRGERQEAEFQSSDQRRSWLETARIHYWRGYEDFRGPDRA